MAAPLKVRACVEWDTTGSTCVSEVWIDPPTIIPTLSVADAQAIGIKLCAAVVIVRLVAWLRQAWSDRIEA